MADSFLVKIDLEKLQANLAQAENRRFSNEEVEFWLSEYGFKRSRNDWIAEELSLDALDRSEYCVIRRL
jgi:hypothetical protein